MKINFILKLGMYVMILCFHHIMAEEIKKVKVAVLDFQCEGGGLQRDIGKIVVEWLTNGLIDTGRVEIIEKRIIQKAIEERKISTAELKDPKKAAELGKILGVSGIVGGIISGVGGDIEINVHLISVETGSIVASEGVRISVNIDLSRIIETIVSEVSPLEGYVVKRRGNIVTVDLGKLNGVKVGMRFGIFKEGSTIRHPKTGEIVEIERIKIGEIAIKEVEEKTSKGIILKEEENEKIEYGLKVKSLPEEEVWKPLLPLPEGDKEQPLPPKGEEEPIKPKPLEPKPKPDVPVPVF